MLLATVLKFYTLRGVAKYGSRGVEVKGFHWLMARRGHHSCHSISVHTKPAHFSTSTGTVTDIENQVVDQDLLIGRNLLVPRGAVRRWRPLH